ncbi:tRNA (adenosine(37)-N6)-threonylcarbamoyltransferase complex dimerization subunit type 1 TsaB [Thalassotalea sp. M1531]|uniref:tRNA threonylcarbamoyladenosine biosynthesis protein TsaB n=1 Tax=Thalassotalea algicola TaxID=2716224 RepID=A0A7Y0LB74_9GAMM|nr:tRNA (adenosine(37)-N6)-threonylcarbamoyltransferase complex dimerization subunit type 1 TsaB [Thalassotalea algicola]NMP31333.1 tRNA (adenosine(37)-N6)-threonylcarbamoyltransferase complex dimerization subunit type 1 TsaB [Thalassotalea algicola]
MKLLAIDASTEACSVAIYNDGNVYSDFELCPQSHSLVLLPMVDRLLKESNSQLSDFDALVYGRGPGSFTGVRIGIGVAQGLAFAADIPTIGISTMQTMAQEAFEVHGQKYVNVAIDARMSEVYCSSWHLTDKGLMELATQEQVMPPEKFSSLIENSGYGVGTGWQAYPQYLAEKCQNNEEVAVLYPNAKYMIPSAIQSFKNGETQPADQAQPVYVRDTVSWKKLPGRE